MISTSVVGLGIRSAVVGVLLLCLFGAIAHAQSTGAIQGVVTDQSGAAVPNAGVTIRNEATGEERATVTDSSGIYQAPSLPVGRYRVTVKATGMQQMLAGGLQVEVGRAVQQNFTLQVAAAAETVQVSAAAAAIETSSVAVGAVINQTTVQEIPLNGRHFVDLSLLAPGTVVPPTNGFLTAPLRGQGSFAINTAGMREDTTNFMINGINMNDMSNGQIAFQPSINTVQEFKLENSTFNAEYGRNSGSIVNIATRSGTNDWHGELFEFLRNNDLDARNFFNPRNTLVAGVEKPQPMGVFKRNNFGADGGGAIWKDHTFFFVSYEALRQRQGITISQPVLTNAQRAQAESIGNPTLVKLLPLIPAGNSGDGLFVGSATAPVNIDQGTANVSHTFSPKDRINWYWIMQQDLRQEPTLQGNNIPGFGDSRASRRQIMTINETHVFTPELVNEARLGYNRLRITFTPNAELNPADFGMNIGVNTAIGLPQITINDINLNFGGPNNFPQGRGVYTATFSDALSWIHGKHSLKFGGEVRRFDGNHYTQTAGTMQFSTTANFLNGLATVFTANPSANPARIFETATGAFVQDSWKVLPTLTLDFGLRWEWNGTPVEAENRFSVFNASTDSLVRVGSPGPAKVYNQNHLIEPRLGFVWDVLHNQRTIVRGAYAILGDQPVEGLVGGLYTNPPFANPVSFNGPGTVTFANAFTAAAAAGSLAPLTVAQNFHDAYVQDWNLNVQQLLPGDVTVMAGYFANKATHLKTAENINQFLPGTSNRPFPALSSSSPIDPNAKLGNITLWDSAGNSNYNALWLTATKRFAHGLQFDASYTWSKAMDETSLNSPSSPFITLQDSNNVRGDRGLSDYDARHHFVFSGIYDLPLHGNRALNGWQVALVNTLQSGNPVNLITTSTYTGSANTVRPNVTGPVRVGIGSAFNGNPQYWPACGPGLSCPFALPAAFGNLGRNVLIGPGFEDQDISLIKKTKITERLVLETRCDAFNILNHANFNQPNRTFATSANNSFGQITSTRGPTGDSGSSRQIQFAMKVTF